jgi:hypothetical protein
MKGKREKKYNIKEVMRLLLQEPLGWPMMVLGVLVGGIGSNPFFLQTTA